MRGLTVMTLCLGLFACAVDNPGFAPASNSSSGSNTTTDGPVTTGATVTSDASGTTSGASDSANTNPNPSEPITSSTSEPGGTQTSEPSTAGDSSTGPVGPPICDVPDVNDAFEPYVFVEGAPLPQCGPSLALKGQLVLGDEIEFYNDVGCGDMNPPATFLLGSGYPPFTPQAPEGCFSATATFKPGEACEIAQLWIAPLGDINKPLVFGAFTAPALMPFPIKPTVIQESYCGCPEGGDDPNICCDELQPGVLSLIPSDGGPVGQSNHEPVEVNGDVYEFYNLESWQGPDCANAPGTGRHIDWIAVGAQ